MTLHDDFRARRAAAERPTLEARRRHLRTLERTIKTRADTLVEAVRADFGNRSLHETRLLEIFPSVEGARHARKHLGAWMRTQERPVAPYFAPAKARVVWQPKGVVGIIVPWNYPILLAVEPLIAALAAGNQVMIKMSELAPRTAEAFAELMRAAFPDGRVCVVSGDADVAKAFAALPFDHLLFTGSTSVGRSVMRAAAEQLTPVTLELGGKSPVIVGDDAPIATVAARVMSGKCRNAGQTCVAPDYLLMPETHVDAFIDAARAIVATRYPTVLGNPDYTSIISDRHFDRILAALDDARAQGARIVALHPHDAGPHRDSRTIPPLAILDARETMTVLQDEIFGPLLPILTYRTLDEAIAYVNARPRPLALYYFGNRQADIDRVLGQTISGGVTINDVLFHFAQESLPAGGIGPSGMGAYHGRDGFETFSHKRAIFEQARISGTGFLEPPYGARFAALLKLLLR